MRRAYLLFLVVAAAAAYLGTYHLGGSAALVVYVAHDQTYSESVIERFEQETGVEVRAVFDTEATKSAGLAQLILEERDRPSCDVFWNNEVSRTVRLAEAGVLEPYVPETAADIPAWARDPAGRWHGFGARARVIVYNTTRMTREDAPRGVEDLLAPALAGRFAIADPRFGTTGAHVAALLAVWGPERTERFLAGLAANGARVAPGNGAVLDLVAQGATDCGLVDTDDAFCGIARGDPIALVVPDQGDGGLGTLVIPNSVALVKGGPHPDLARAFIRWLLRPETEALLAAGPARQIPLRPGVPIPTDLAPWLGVRRMAVAEVDIARALPEAMALAERTIVP